MFENLLGNLKEKFAESQEKKRIEKEELAKMQREIDFQEKIQFQKSFKEHALEIAIGRAKKNAATKSGIAKLQAQNRLRRLQEPGSNNPSSFFNKFSSFTQKNLARRDENLKRTAEGREDAKKIIEEKGLTKPQTSELRKPFQIPERRKPFQPSGFGNR